MPDKTIVTKDPVTESGDKTVVTNGTVPESVRKEIENSVRENLRAEYGRESEALKGKLSQYEERIEELEEQGRLSAEDRELLSRLRGKKDDLEEELKILENDPKYRAYNEKIKRDSKSAKDQAVSEARWQFSVDLMEDNIEKWAADEKIEAKALREELNSYAARYKEDKDGNVILPHRRAERAMRDRLKDKELTKREDELKKKELELKGELESGQGSVRERSLDEIKQSGDTIARAKKLGL